MATHVLLMTAVLVFQIGKLSVNGVTEVRLTGGPSPRKGTVEIQKADGNWETTCGLNFDINDAIVICKQLGFSSANRAIPNTPFGQVSIPANGLACNGGETDVSECNEFRTPSCMDAAAATCHDERYLGCFEDNVNDRVFSGVFLMSDPDMSISYCIAFCDQSTSNLYVYAGVENGDECFCGTANNNYRQHGLSTDRNCNSPCAGNDTESCGGVSHIAVFTTSSAATTWETPTIPSTKLGETVSNTLNPGSTTSTANQSAGRLDCSKETTITVIVAVFLCVVCLYAAIMTLLFLRFRRTIISLKRDEKRATELDPYTSLERSTLEHPPTYAGIQADTSLDKPPPMREPAYDDTHAPAMSGRPHATGGADGGATYENQTISEQRGRMRNTKSEKVQNVMEPEYMDIKA